MLSMCTFCWFQWKAKLLLLSSLLFGWFAITMVTDKHQSVPQSSFTIVVQSPMEWSFFADNMEFFCSWAFALFTFGFFEWKWECVPSKRTKPKRLNRNFFGSLWNLPIFSPMGEKNLCTTEFYCFHVFITICIEWLFHVRRIILLTDAFRTHCGWRENAQHAINFRFGTRQ